MLVQQFLKVNSHSLTNFAVTRNHLSTIKFHIKVSLFFATKIACRTVQNFGYPGELPFLNS